MSDWKYVQGNIQRVRPEKDPTEGFDYSLCGWIVCNRGAQGLLSYPVLYLPRPTINEIYTAYEQHPNRGKK